MGQFELFSTAAPRITVVRGCEPGPNSLLHLNKHYFRDLNKHYFRAQLRGAEAPHREEQVEILK